MEQRATPADTTLSEVSHVLWRQRALIETLLYRLEVQQLLLSAGQDRWVAKAADEVENALADIREQELVRAAVVERSAQALGLARSSTLSALRDAAPEPWDEILGDHQTTFLTLVAEAEELTRQNRELLNRGLVETRMLFQMLGAGSAAPDGYSKEGRSTHSWRLPTLVDRDA